MGVLGLRLQFHQVDDIHHPDFQLRQMRAKERDRREGLQRGHVAATGHDHIGLPARVVARPRPDPDPGGAVGGGRIHGQPLRRGMFAGDHDVDVMPAAQAVVHDGEQTVGVGRQVNPDDLGLFVHDVVDKARILMGETVVILAPHMRSEEVV